MALTPYYSQVSDEYRASVLSDIDDSTMQAYIEAAPPGALKYTLTSSTAGLAPTYDGYTYVDALSSTARGMGKKWASFEQDRIYLDGSFSFIESSSYAGEWYKPSGTITATLTLSADLEIPGVTVVFDDTVGGYPTYFSVVAYDTSGTFLFGHTITDNTESVAYIDFEDIGLDEAYAIGRLDIEVDATTWVNGYYPKISAVFPGLFYKFTDDEILSFELTEEAGFFDTSKPVPQSTLVCVDPDGDFNPLNKRTLATTLDTGCPLKCYITVGGFSVNMGEWSIYEWSADTDNMTVSFTSRPKIGFDLRFTSVSLAEDTPTFILNEVARKCGITKNIGTIGSRFAALPASYLRYFGEGAQISSAIQALMNSTAAYLDIGRDDMYNIVDLYDQLWPITEEYSGDESEVVRYIGYNDMFTRPRLTHSRPFYQVIAQYQTVDGDSVIAHEVAEQIGDILGDTFYLYSNQVQDETTASILLTDIANEASGALMITATIKGDPALRPGDPVRFDIDGLPVEWEWQTITKVTHHYSEGILTSDIEAIYPAWLYINRRVDWE